MKSFRSLLRRKPIVTETPTSARPDIYPESIRYIIKYGSVRDRETGSDYYSISWSDLQCFADNNYHDEIIYFSCRRAADQFKQGGITEETMQEHVEGLYATLQLAQNLRRQHPNDTFVRWSSAQMTVPVGSKPEEEYCRVQKLRVISYLGPNSYFQRLDELPTEFQTNNNNYDLHPVLLANSMYLGVSAWIRNLAATGQPFSMLDPKTGICYSVSASDGGVKVDWGTIAGGDTSLYPVIIDDIYRTGKSVEKAKEVLSSQGFSVGNSITSSIRYLTGFTLPT